MITTRLRLREPVFIIRSASLSQDLRSNVQSVGVSTIDMDDNVSFTKNTLGVTVLVNEPKQQVFIPWAMVRQIDEEPKEPVVIVKKTKKRK